jgi:hypothetical protein
VRAARETWLEGQLDLDPDRLVFIDETAANTAMTRRYGRAPRSERCRMSVPQGHWKTTTITAGLRASGITAPWLLDGAMSAQAFRTYVADVLAPTPQPGDTVVLDNLPAHKPGIPFSRCRGADNPIQFGGRQSAPRLKELISHDRHRRFFPLEKL